MDLVFYPDIQTVKKAIAADDPLCMLVSFTGERAIIANIDDVAEHCILLKKAGFSALDIDRYFRIVVNKSGASWTFVCPQDYLHISDRARRITRFAVRCSDRYSGTISKALERIEGYGGLLKIKFHASAIRIPISAISHV